MPRVLRIHAKDFAALVGLFVIAAAVALYVLDHQRLRFPLLDPKPFTLKAEFSTAQAVTPGQGQTVRVAGVRVGDISKTELVDGRAIITMELDKRFDDLVHTDATATLRPKTGLKDMFVELDPGTAGAKLATRNWTMPISATLPDVNPDEFLSALDADTRDHLKLLLNGASIGLKDNGDDLREVLARFEPTYRDIAKVSGVVKQRSHELRRLIDSLEKLNRALAGRDDDLARLVQSSSGVFRALASERGNVQATVRELPGALAATRDALAKVQQFATVLRPAAGQLVPVAQALREANAAVTPFAKEAAPLLKRDVRPFVRAARPTVRQLRPAADRLVKAEPNLTRTFVVLNHLFNMLGYNAGGAEGPDKADRSEGYLFALAWLGHQSTSLFSSGDAHGVARPITLGGTCATFKNIVKNAGDQAAFLMDLVGILTDPSVCGGGGNGD